MSMDVSDFIADATAEETKTLSKPAYIGQPVDARVTHTIMRIAL
jgi:hypothetical protein